MPVDADALERLRKLRRLGVRRGAQDLARPAPRPAEHGPALLPGEAVETPFGPAWLCTVRYRLTDHPDFAGLLATRPEILAALGQDHGLQALEPAHAAFVDTETTGLSLGTGTYTFLIGVGSYEGIDGDGEPAFVVRQFLMRNPAEERGQLHLVEEALSGCTGIISFNGRAFDLPLLQNRFMLAYMPAPLPGAPHLDLLPPARRIWRGYLPSCSLGELERSVLAVERTAADVPGWMIPGIYRDFYNSPSPANLELMSRVLYHNQTDITSMVLLAGRMAELFQEDAVSRLAGLHPLECASLARCYQTLGWVEQAEAAYSAAFSGLAADGERVEILRSWSFWRKRVGRRNEAAELWETWVTTGSADDITPYTELAKHHEWHTGDLAAARGWTAWALRILENGNYGATASRELRGELERRLARLERKLTLQAQPSDNDIRSEDTEET